MMIALFLAAILIVALIAAGVAGIIVWRRRWSWSVVTKRRVLVQTDADVSFEGILLERRGGLLHLTDVTVRTADSARADGSIVIERSRVLWMQVIA